MRGLLSLLLAACGPLDLDEPEPYAWVVYDPSAGVVPVPNDLLLDAATGRLALPAGDDLPDAERAFREALNQRAGWPTTFPARVAFSEAVDPVSVDADSVQVWAWGTPPVRVAGVTLTLAADGAGLVIEPPAGGWDAGGRYAVVVRGGEGGVTTPSGLPLGPDAAMWFLRSEAALDAPEHQRAFPGATRAERLEAAARLEGVRAALAPFVDAIGVPRDEIAALWSFSVSRETEVAMDRSSLRVPIPFDLLIDPATGLVDLTLVDEDTPLEAEAKRVANTLDGFGVSADPTFETTEGLDPVTVGPDSVQLWKLDGTPQRVGVRPRLIAEDGDAACRRSPGARDCRYVFVGLGDSLPLDPGTTYAVVVTSDVRDVDGGPVRPMPLGALLTNPHPLVVEGRSQVASLDDATAARLETSRAAMDLLLDGVGREKVVAAWPFTTIDPSPRLRDLSYWAEEEGHAPRPRVRWRRPASSILEDDAIGELFPGALNPGPAVYVGRTSGVRHVVSGTIDGIDFLDDVTRRWRPTPEIEPIPFWAVVPSDVQASRPAPVVIFGHAVVTDRRFALFVASELAARGFVVVSIDWPYHGERVACVDASLVAVPNFLPPALQGVTGLDEPLLWFPPCESGDEARCSPTGQCLDARGRIEPFSTFPILDMQPVSGAAFLDTHDLPHIPDHVHQSLVDLSTLVASLRTGAWDGALDQRIATDRFLFLGQSLGSILGTVWVAHRDDVDRAVFNVPGSNLVDLFKASGYFQPQIDQYFADLGLVEGSYEQQRLVQVASWLIDTVDPHTVAHRYRSKPGFSGMIQMDKVSATSGDLVIPNFTTENLARVSGLPVTAYPSVLHADLIVPVVGDGQLREAAEFLERP